MALFSERMQYDLKAPSLSVNKSILYEGARKVSSTAEEQSPSVERSVLTAAIQPLSSFVVG